MKNLISMTDYIIQQHEQCISSTGRTYNYAKFLKQPLELWMFIPCDEDGNVLQVPIFKNTLNSDKHHSLWEEYRQAKERCLFEELSEKDAKFVLHANENIEDLIEFNLQLTQTAIKQLGL